MAVSQAVRHRILTPVSLVQIQYRQLWTGRVLQNGKPLVDGYTPINNLIAEGDHQ